MYYPSGSVLIAIGNFYVDGGNDYIYIAKIDFVLNMCIII